MQRWVGLCVLKKYTFFSFFDSVFSGGRRRLAFSKKTNKNIHNFHMISKCGHMMRSHVKVNQNSINQFTHQLLGWKF